MKQLTILSGRCLVVELPSWETIEKELSIHGHDEGLTESEFKEYVYSKCPPGNWRIIGTLSEVTEGEASNIVQSFKFKDGYLYNNYITGNRDTTDTALESLDSAIESEGYRFTNPHGDLPSKTDMGAALSWEQAQSRVLCRERCLLLGREGV